MRFWGKKTQKVSFKLNFWVKDAYASKSKRAIYILPRLTLCRSISDQIIFHTVGQ